MGGDGPNDLALSNGKPVRGMSLREIREAGEDAVSCLDAFGEYGISTDVHNAMVDLAYLLHEALTRFECKS